MDSKPHHRRLTDSDGLSQPGGSQKSSLVVIVIDVCGQFFLPLAEALRTGLFILLSKFSALPMLPPLQNTAGRVVSNERAVPAHAWEKKKPDRRSLKKKKKGKGTVSHGTFAFLC